MKILFVCLWLLYNRETSITELEESLTSDVQESIHVRVHNQLWAVSSYNSHFNNICCNLLISQPIFEFKHQITAHGCLFIGTIIPY